MCIVSMIHDHYERRYRELLPVRMPWYPWPQPGYPIPQINPKRPVKTIDNADIEKLFELGREYRDSIEKAKELDSRTAQPDCEDPAKAALEKRVAELEAELQKIKAELVKKPRARKARASKHVG